MLVGTGLALAMNAEIHDGIVCVGSDPTEMIVGWLHRAISGVHTVVGISIQWGQGTQAVHWQN